MQNLIFVIGATAAGKTYFINEHYKDKDVEILNIYDYQQRAYDEAGYGKGISLGAGIKCLYKANDDLLKDIIDRLQAGRDVVVEHTLFKMKRRLAYIDEIRKSVDVNIIFYVLCPDDTQWQANIEKRKLDGKFEHYKKMAQDIEFPNQAEGIDKIYEVADGEIKLRMEPPKSNELLEQAGADIRLEAERMRDKGEKKRQRQELIESMNTRPFWHYCESCGKKEFITAQEAYDNGWDYPPKIGEFGLLSPRTCGNCSMKGTLYFKIQQQRVPIVFKDTLTPEELITWRRIQGEPESLLTEDYDVKPSDC
ncbi:MAG: ATP-binding protein [Clostridium sp.]|nr:ATP-binding protein [Clostridium sp.]